MFFYVHFSELLCSYVQVIWISSIWDCLVLNQSTNSLQTLRLNDHLSWIQNFVIIIFFRNMEFILELLVK